ncbi:MAG: hypothetical protein OXC44_02270 [Proteobacteria bacterium]|nr:hypothetical protein [Pseudomonadota bacterium]
MEQPRYNKGYNKRYDKRYNKRHNKHSHHHYYDLTLSVFSGLLTMNTMKWSPNIPATFSMLGDRASCSRCSLLLVITLSMSVVLMSFGRVHAQALPLHAYNTSQVFSRSVPWQRFGKIPLPLVTNKHTAHITGLAGLALLSYHMWQKWVLWQSGGEGVFSAPLAVSQLASSTQPQKDNYPLDSVSDDLQSDYSNYPEDPSPVFIVPPKEDLTEDDQDSEELAKIQHVKAVASLTEIFRQTMADDPQSIINTLLWYLQKQNDYRGENYPFLKAQNIQYFVDHVLDTSIKKHVFFSFLLHLNQDKMIDIARDYRVKKDAIYQTKLRMLKQLKELATTGKVNTNTISNYNHYVRVEAVVSGEKPFSYLQNLYHEMLEREPEDLVFRWEHFIKHYRKYNTQSLNYLHIDQLSRYERLYLNTQKKKHILYSLILRLDDASGVYLQDLYQLRSSGTIANQKKIMFSQLLALAHTGKLQMDFGFRNIPEKTAPNNNKMGIKNLEDLDRSFNSDLDEKPESIIQFIYYLLKDHPQFVGQELRYITVQKLKKYVSAVLVTPKKKHVFYSLVLHQGQLNSLMFSDVYKVDRSNISRIRKYIIDDLFYMATHKELMFQDNGVSNAFLKKTQPSSKNIKDFEDLVDIFHYNTAHYGEDILREVNIQVNRRRQKRGLEDKVSVSMDNINEVFKDIEKDRTYQHIFLSTILQLDDANGEFLASLYKTSSYNISVRRSKVLDQFIELAEKDEENRRLRALSQDSNDSAVSSFVKGVPMVKLNLLKYFSSISTHHQLGRFKSIVESLDDDDISSYMNRGELLHSWHKDIDNISRMANKDLKLEYRRSPHKSLLLTSVNFIHHVVSRREHGIQLRIDILESEYGDALQAYRNLTDDQLRYRIAYFILENLEGMEERLSTDVISTYKRNLFDKEDLYGEDKLRAHVFLCMIELCDSTHLELAIAYDLVNVQTLQLIVRDLKYVLRQILPE